MMSTLAKNIQPTADDAALAKEASRLLAKLDQGDEPVHVKLSRNSDDLELTLPASSLRVLLDALINLGDGRPVTVVGQDTELSTVEAAKFLNVSRPFLVDLLESGTIPFHKVGSHRRVRFQDLAEYKERDNAERKARLDELSRLDEEMGIL